MAHKKPVLLMILDGYGLAAPGPGNAVNNAHTPHLDRLVHDRNATTLAASGAAVGLPEGQIGNSEVGHLHIGAGRTIYTGLSLINKLIADGEFAKNEALLKTIGHVKAHNSKLHIMGLYSAGGVHSLDKHLLAALKIAHDHGLKPILHIYGDGRDVPPQSLADDLAKLADQLKALSVTIGVISGRFYAMDRDKRWDRIQRAYDALLDGKGNQFTDPVAYIQDQYAKGIYDEFIEPAVNANVDKKAITIADGDGVFFANFRPDRARQLSHCLYGSTVFDYVPSRRVKDLFFTIMMPYEGIVPSAVAVIQPDVNETLGEIYANAGLKQLRIAETEKYAHVTFFFDGGKELPLPHSERKLIPSNRSVPTYDLAPEMACKAITDQLIPTLGQYALTVLNYANPDMVGHTGHYAPTVQGLEALDVQIGRLLEACQQAGVTLFFTADHGNAETMIDADGQPVTKHTANPVPFACTDPQVKLSGSNGTLADVAPTILAYVGLKQPQVMTGKSLIIN